MCCIIGLQSHISKEGSCRSHHKRQTVLENEMLQHHMLACLHLQPPPVDIFGRFVSCVFFFFLFLLSHASLHPSLIGMLVQQPSTHPWPTHCYLWSDFRETAGWTRRSLCAYTAFHFVYRSLYGPLIFNSQQQNDDVSQHVLMMLWLKKSISPHAL